MRRESSRFTLKFFRPQRLFTRRTLNVSATLFSNSSYEHETTLSRPYIIDRNRSLCRRCAASWKRCAGFFAPGRERQGAFTVRVKGKYVVLEWFNPQCPFVKKHYGSSNMQNLQKEFTDKGVVWLTIDSNAPGTEGNLTPEEAQKIATSWKTHETALLLDPEGNAGRAYGAKNTPNMVIINPEGKIIYRGAIDSKATPNPSDIPSSTNYVKAALDQSLSGKSVATPETKPYGCSVKYKSS